MILLKLKINEAWRSSLSRTFGSLLLNIENFFSLDPSVPSCFTSRTLLIISELRSSAVKDYSMNLNPFAVLTRR